MPFDECNHEGGGGPDRHNAAKLDEMARLSLLQLSVNCENNDLCEFHAGLWMQGLMAQGLLNTVRKHEGCATSMDMLDQQIAKMSATLETLRTERSKWKTR